MEKSMEESFVLKEGVDPSEALIIARKAKTTDGIAPLSEQYLLGLEDPSMGHTHVGIFELSGTNECLVGFAAISGDSAEFVVNPDHRGKGYGTELADEVTRRGIRKIWAHGNLPSAVQLGVDRHMVVTRRLLVMGTSTLDFDVELPEGFELMNLTQAREQLIDADGQWLKANNEAFSWHPEQGGWDAARLARAQRVEWFRPDDVLFLVTDGTIAGFHWLKRHSPTLGEIYVVGLARDFRGRGLGDPLVRAGLRHLYDAGMNRVILYVEENNWPAVNAYKALGFQTEEHHVVYEPQAVDG